MSNIDAMREWYAKAIKTSGHNASVTAVDAEEFFDLHTSAGKAIKANHAVRVSGTGNIRVNGFQVSLNGGVLYINPPTMQKKGVAETSVQAYRSLNIPESVQVVAKAAIELSTQKGYCTDATLAQYTSIPAAIISARRNDMEKVGVVTIDGVAYKLEGMGIKRNPSGKSAKAWRLVAEAKQATLFQD